MVEGKSRTIVTADRRTALLQVFACRDYVCFPITAVVINVRTEVRTYICTFRHIVFYLDLGL